MPPVALKTSAGAAVSLHEEIARGGEGAVYATSQPGVCAKIYHKPLTLERAQKIRVMSSGTFASLAAVASWPIDLVSDSRGRPVGLVMPQIDGRKDVHKLYSPKSRRSEFMRADWRFLIRASTNIARAFGEVHRSGCVIGDVNHGSVLIAQDARVMFIDCDSFQVVSGSETYLCEVGVETYTPPELQDRSFKGVVRTADHDNFGLAVLVFHLLMMGRHPFAGRFLGAGEMQIAKAIEERRFVYGARHRLVQMERPPGSPDLAILGPQVSALFEMAFTATQAGFRPSAKAWMEALSQLEAQTIQCKSSQSHWYLSSLPACPWCAMELATGTPLFPAVFQGATGPTGFDVAAVAKRLSSLSGLGPAPIIALPDLSPSDSAMEVGRQRRKWRIGCVLLMVVGFVIGMAFGALLLAVAGAGVGFVTFAGINAYDKALKSFKEARETAEGPWSLLRSSWEKQCDGASFEAKCTTFLAAKPEWDRIPQERARRLTQLETDRRRLQFERFLDSFYIEQAKISGIGRGRKDLLASEGIETALDLVDQRLMVLPGFGPMTRSKLLEWRRDIERGFVFDPTKAVDPKDRMAIEQAILAERKRVEDRLQVLADAAFQEHARISLARTQLLPAVEAAAREFTQRDVDLKAAR